MTSVDGSCFHKFPVSERRWASVVALSPGRPRDTLLLADPMTFGVYALPGRTHPAMKPDADARDAAGRPVDAGFAPPTRR
ncbi:MAG: hypothetical protein ACE5E6_09465 [Phycisphaerae bacterium]